VVVAGENVHKFESAFAKMFNVKHTHMVNSWSSQNCAVAGVETLGRVMITGSVTFHLYKTIWFQYSLMSIIHLTLIYTEEDNTKN
jgi:hypothetical protein